MDTTTIWNDFKQALYAYIRARISDKEAAEDILQEVFIKIHLKSGSLKERDKLTSWLYQITRNTIIDYYRKKKLTHNVAVFEKGTDTDIASDDRLFACVRPFMNSLSRDYRRALYLTTYGKLSQKEYAQQEQISYTAAKSRVQRARRKLKELMVSCCAIEADKYGNIISVNPSCSNC